jgi:PhzF family phenazine biosynthesis protein
MQHVQTKIIRNKLLSCVIFLFPILIPLNHCFATKQPGKSAMDVPVYIVDAFTDKPFSGNPAAVCPLPEWINDSILQNIAAEINLSETAFFVKRGEVYELRWFTPEVEVDLCGHGTLAAAHVIFDHLNYGNSQIEFATKSGGLTVSRNKELYLMDFPSIVTTPQEYPEILEQSLGAEPDEVLVGSWLYLAVYEDGNVIGNLDPDLVLMEKLGKAVVVTAKGSDDIDFVSRCFSPDVGIPEDPVTGSAHCALVPYWSARLNKTTFFARQLSRRGGELYCELAGERVIIGGKAVTFSIGRIIMD